MTIKRLFDIPHYALEKYPKTDMFVTKYHGEWKKLLRRSLSMREIRYPGVAEAGHKTRG